MDDARRIEEQNTLKRSQILGLEFLDTSQIADKKLFKDLLSNQEMYSNKVIPIRMEPGAIDFGITTTTSQHVSQQIGQRFGDHRCSFFLISDAGFREYMRLYDPPKQVHYQEIAISGDANATIQNVSTMLSQVRADDMLAYLVQQAYRLKASDIHIETGKQSVRVRFRVDGVLHPIAIIEPDRYRLLMSALASSADISNASDKAQTGHITKTYNMADGAKVDVNVRVETVPTVFAQDAVLRLFNFQSDFLSLDKLGLQPEERKLIDGIIHNPQGLVLVVGPTGSGKTTTMYSLLNELNHPELKVITLEDPVEYQIEGITQIPIKTSKEEGGFAEKLRSVLRLDPDVIMVGEIRDLDTAKTALQAALTGHLVLSTYHASSAAAALTRMLDAIGENPLFINAIKLITAQRLVRRLDDKTKQAYEPDEITKNYVTNVVNSLPEKIQKPDLSSIKLYKPVPSAENPFGFSGQMAIRELMVMTPQLQMVLRRPARELSTLDIEKTAMDSGMLSLLQVGVLKVLAGETTLEEVSRVIG